MRLQQQVPPSAHGLHDANMRKLEKVGESEAPTSSHIIPSWYAQALLALETDSWHCWFSTISTHIVRLLPAPESC